MGTAEPIGTTMSPTLPEIDGERRFPTSRKLVLAFAILGLAAGVFATVRLGAVVAATPPERWLAQDGQLVDPGITVGATTRVLAEHFSAVISDPALVRGRLAACYASAATAAEQEANHAACLTAVDDALRTSPSSAELWLFRATALARNADFGDELLTALRNSYTAGAREGWIASGRVVLGLRLWYFLPEDLQAQVRSDLDIVLRNNLAGPLAAAYVKDPAMRRAAMPALQTLPGELMDRFVWTTRDVINPAAAGS